MSESEYKLTLGKTDFSLNIGKEDLLAVAVANYEQQQLARKAALAVAIRTKKSEMDALLKSCNKAEKVLAEAVEEENIQNYIKAGAALGFDLKVKTELSYAEEGRLNVMRVIYEAGAAEIRIGYGCGVSSTVVRRTIDPTPEIVETRSKIEQEEKNIQALGQELSEVMGNLHNLATKEREARAHLVVKSLKTTPEGQAVLDALTGDGSPFMLPGPSEK